MISLEHIGICSKDTVALKIWYETILGLKTIYDNKKEKPTFFLLVDDQHFIEIYPMEEAAGEYGNKKQGIRHLAFRTDDIDLEYERLLEHKVEIVEGYKVSPKGVKTVFFLDLEGNILHYIQRQENLF